MRLIKMRHGRSKVEVRAAKVVRRHRNRKEFSERLVGAKLGSTARLGNLLLLGLDGEASIVLNKLGLLYASRADWPSAEAAYDAAASGAIAPTRMKR